MNKNFAYNMIYKKIAEKYNTDIASLKYGYIDCEGEIGVQIAYLDKTRDGFACEVVENTIQNGEFVIELYDCIYNKMTQQMTYDLLERHTMPAKIYDVCSVPEKSF